MEHTGKWLRVLCEDKVKEGSDDRGLQVLKTLRVTHHKFIFSPSCRVAVVVTVCILKARKMTV